MFRPMHDGPPPVSTVTLVSCVSVKAHRPLPARELYRSAWFKKARAYVEEQGGPWFILSARHGLLHPDQVVAPYNETLRGMRIQARRDWAARVEAELRATLPATERIVVLAGKLYREFLLETLRDLCSRVEIPLEGLAIGKQLRWFCLNTRLPSLIRFHDLLEDLARRTGGPRRLGDCHGRMRWPRRGVYFLLDDDERRSDSGDGPRVVRVGTHAVGRGARTTLWNRLSQHRGVQIHGGGNHRGSVFRKLIGNALQNARPELRCRTWGVGASAEREVREGEHALECAVSEVLRDLRVTWLAVDDAPGPDSLRGVIERGAIALLSNRGRPPLDPPSKNWLGHECDKEKVRASGLWNERHVEENPSPTFLDPLERVVGRA